MQLKNKKIRLVGIIFLLQILCCFHLAMAQDWAVFNPERQYNYGANGAEYAELCVKVDSVSVSNAVSVYYLNKIIREWEDGPFQDNQPLYYRYNQSHFLQDSVIETDSSFLFYGESKFKVLKYTGKNMSWEFDSEHSIQANFAKPGTMEIFGQADSVICISLSSGDTIVLSKSFGILRFDPVYEKTKYLLLGIENISGIQTYNFRDIYDFNPGDIFEYEWSGYNPDGWPPSGVYRHKILERSDEADNITYEILVNEIYHSGGEEYRSQYTRVITYKYSDNDPVNALPGQLLDIGTAIYSCYGVGDVYSIGYQNTTLYQITKFIDHAYFNCEYIDSMPGYLKRVETGWEGYKRTFAPGLGVVNTERSCFEEDYILTLSAYKKNGIAYGTFLPDYIYLEREDQSLDAGISIYPNPADEVIHFEVRDQQEIFSVAVYSAFGACMGLQPFNEEMDVSNLAPGVYFIELYLWDHCIRKRIIIQ